MAKQKTAEQMAIAKAKKVKEKHFHISRQQSWGWWKKPWIWGFQTDWKRLRVGIGEPKVKFHGEEVAESRWLFTMRWFPLNDMHLWLFKERKAVIRLGSGF
jgi:hypothetical protein